MRNQTLALLDPYRSRSNKRLESLPLVVQEEEGECHFAGAIDDKGVGHDREVDEPGRYRFLDRKGPPRDLDRLIAPFERKRKAGSFPDFIIFVE